MNSASISLKRIIQEATLAGPNVKRLDNIVTEVKSAMGADVCSLYVAHDDKTLLLTATNGLNNAAIGRVHMEIGEGLVGIAAKTCHPINTDDAANHEGYRYFPITHEELYHAFLGVPLICLGKLNGVLVVQKKPRIKFTSEEEAFLTTVAQYLAIIISTQQSTLTPSHGKERGMRRVSGVKGSSGIGIGSVHLVSNDGFLNIPDRKITQTNSEIKSFRKAVRLAKRELKSDHDRLSVSLPQGITNIFSAYRMILNDAKFLAEVEKEIRSGLWAPGALRRVITRYIKLFEAMNDSYFKSRAEDIHHIGRKLYANLLGIGANSAVETNALILFGDVVGVTDIVRFRPEQLVGILCRSGSILSHTAVVANALGIPAVMGLGITNNDICEGMRAIIDGYQAEVIFNPTPDVEAEYQTHQIQEQELQRNLAQLRNEPATSPDNIRIKLYVNTGLLSDISPGLDKGAEGIGLYRTELRFMLSDSFPTEEEQYRAYRHVLQEYQGKPVTMRTLDIGGDKILPYFRFDEPNPSLGWRGIRFSLDNTPILMAQIRAMLRASEGVENLRILLPMVSRIGEVDAFKDFLASAYQQLTTEGYHVIFPPIGVMVEVPAAISILDFLASRVEFISIGSNDLSQYLLAVDRNNPRVSGLLDNLHPAVLREVNSIVKKAKQLKLNVGLCGEMASDPYAVVLLIGMGIESLSMSAYNLPKIKHLIRSVPHHTAVEWLEDVLTMGHENEIRRYLSKQMSLHQLDIVPSNISRN